MPDTLEYGVSSPEVKTLQKQLNELAGASTLKTDGSFDEKTVEELKRFQRAAGLSPTGALDKPTAAAIKDALIPRTEVTFKGKTYRLTKDEYAAVSAQLTAQLAKPAQAYVSMAAEAKTYWEAHDKARNGNKVFAFIIEGASGANFPAKGLIAAAEAEAKAMQSAVATGDIKRAQAALKNNAKIRAAFAALSQYRDEIYGGGSQLIKELDKIQTGCVVVLEVSAAVATGGASWQVQVAVSAGVGSYKGLLGEIDKAGKFDPNQSFGSAFGNIILSGAIDGGVTFLMKGPSSKAFIDGVAKKAAEKAAGAAVKKISSKALETFIKNAIEGGSKKAFEELCKDLIKACNPSDKMTLDQAIDNVAKNFAKGALLQQLDGVLGKFGSKTAKQFSQKDFKGLGKVNYDDALKEGGAKVLEQAYDTHAPAAINAAKGDPGKVKAELVKLIKKDPAVQKFFSEKERKKGKKK